MTAKMMFVMALLLLGLLASVCSEQSVTGPAQPDLSGYTPVEASQASLADLPAPAPDSCRVHAVDLLGAWVNAKSPETDAFAFNDISGKACQGTYQADVAPLFTQANLWFPGSLSCRTCHGPDVQISYARMDLSSFAGIMAGTGRASADEKGDDILGGGDWQKADLYDVLNKALMPPGRPAEMSLSGPVVYAGTSK